MRTVLFAAIATLIGVVGSAVPVLERGPVAGAQTTATVSIGDNWFCNASYADGVCDTSITAGDTVLWTNNGTLPHTVTECGPAFTPCPQSGGFDSGTLTNGQTFSRAFPTPGTYEYWCSIHGNAMRGRVIVAAAQQTPIHTPAAPASPGGTASPTPTRTVAAPAAVPGTGGSPTDGGISTPAILAIVAAALLIACAGGGLSVLRRR